MGLTRIELARQQRMLARARCLARAGRSKHKPAEAAESAAAPAGPKISPLAPAGGLPTCTVKRYWSPSTTGCTQASLPALLDRMKVDASGTSAWR